MKKLRKALVVLSVLLSANAFGQLQMESAKPDSFEDIYKFKFGGYVVGTIRFVHYSKSAYLMIQSNNQFENSYHSVYLGNDLESILSSLDDLEKLRKECPKDGVKVLGLGGKDTKIYPYFGGCALVKTDGVVGYGYLDLRFKTKKAKKKVIEYFQNKE